MSVNAISYKLRIHLLSNPSYSVRRYFVDTFYANTFITVDRSASILDLGGKKKNKRGVFSIDLYCNNVRYANLDKNTDPDFYCDATSVPVAPGTFDYVILSEVLEHVPEPTLVLKECFRVLKDGGELVATAPFCFHVHPDPKDYFRYTDTYLREALERCGFNRIEVSKQGGFFAVLTNMLRFLRNDLKKEKSLTARLSYFILSSACYFLEKQFENLDSSIIVKNSNILSGYSTGYSIKAIK